ncbi:hypothetical protein BYT27DRAFT_7259293, partial [Phlegmacium glaucopus]
PLYLLGYIPSHNRVYLTEQDLRIYGYALSLSVVEYQTAILRGDTEAAAEILPTLPKDQLNKTDDLDTALQITHTIPENESEIKWKALGDRALTVWRFDLAKECFEKAGDLSALMLLLVAVGDRDGLKVLAGKAEEKGQNNLAFAILLQLGDATYAPSQAPKAVQAWKSELTSKSRSIFKPELFEEGWKEVLAREEAHSSPAVLVDLA